MSNYAVNGSNALKIETFCKKVHELDLQCDPSPSSNAFSHSQGLSIPKFPGAMSVRKKRMRQEGEGGSLSVCKSGGSNEGTNCNRRITSLSLHLITYTLDSLWLWLLAWIDVPT